MTTRMRIGDVCKWGHVIESDNVKITKRNGREDSIRCRTCDRAASLKAYHSKKSSRIRKKPTPTEDRLRAKREASKRYWQKSGHKYRVGGERQRDRCLIKDCAYHTISRRKSRARMLEQTISEVPIAANNVDSLALTPKQKVAEAALQGARDINGPPRCEVEGPRKWMDDFDEPNEPATQEYARQLCGDCPLLKECDAWAKSFRPGQGVFGGRSWNDGRLV